MSQDFGAIPNGFVNNFAYGKLALANNTYVRLVDLSHNATVSGTEAVYANTVVVPAGCTLDLNGLHLYAHSVQVSGTVVNGSIGQVLNFPPMALNLNTPTAGSILQLGQMDEWTFTGTAGKTVSVLINPGASGSSAPVSPQLQWATIQLLDPNDIPIATGSDIVSGNIISLGGVSLSTSGTYKIHVNAGALHTSATGNYLVSAWDGLLPASVTGTTMTQAVLSGSMNPNGYPTNAHFEYGLTTNYGSVTPFLPMGSGSGFMPVTGTASSLVSGTLYHYRLAVVNTSGTLYGIDQSFTTVASNNADLSGLTITGGTLNTTFTSSGTSYTTTVANSVTSITVTPTVSDTNATFLIAGATGLAVGNNPVTVTVTAQDGVTKKVYTVAVTRVAALNAIWNSAGDMPVTANGFTASGSATLTLNFAPPAGTNLTVVKNTGLGFISGSFSNLAQGQAVPLTFGTSTYHFVANYYGGTGNDLVLQWALTGLVAWGGLNDRGELGNGTMAYSLWPVAVTTSGALLGKTVVTVSAGGLHSLALCSDGSLVAWGYNGFGQLGDGTTTDSSVPIAVDASGALAGKTVVAVSANGFHSLALCSDGTLVAWGEYWEGALGNGTTTGSTVPVEVTTSGALLGKTVVKVSAGGSHSLALCSDGTLVAWGANAFGQLGNGTTTDSTVPIAVSASGALAGKTVVAISAGQYYNLALCSDGTLVGWG